MKIATTLRLHELRHVQKLARLCESHMRDAARCKAAGNTGAHLIHDGLARDYSRDAFALAARVSARAQA
ncbi:MAG: hypothetical protein DI597_00875 [Pseudoxanthomonas spadix]|nr:MAG: hypothetical protein DI597_00875 [Pseudoxanthomonas spadix]